MKQLSRRDFLKSSAAFSTFMIVPAHVLGGRGYTSPADKLNIAVIGAGGQGRSNLANIDSENIYALCDVDWLRAEQSFTKYPKAKKYKDFRIMLDKEKNIDAVLVATPDHTHAVATMAAIKRGLHVYCEKPLTYSIYESRKVTEAARKAGVATQMGNQGHAAEGIRLLSEWIWDGAIGDVHEVHAWTPHPVWPQGMTKRPADTPPVPETIDWDCWLGPAPHRPFHPAYLNMLWRGWLDFGTGGLGDMGCHIFDHIIWSLKLAAPEHVQSSRSHYVDKVTWDIPPLKEGYPRASMVTYQFPARKNMPPLKLYWYDGGLRPPIPDELEPGRAMGDAFGGAIYVGSKGKIVTGSHGASGCRLIPETAMQVYEKPAKTIPRSPGHHKEWLDACKGGAPALSNFDFAGPMTETVLLGNIALLTGKKLYWDAEKMKITNDEEANQYLHRTYREGWSL